MIAFDATSARLTWPSTIAAELTVFFAASGPLAAQAVVPPSATNSAMYPGTKLLVGDDAGETAVELAPLAGGNVLPRRGSEQRVRGPHAPAVVVQEPRIEGLLDRLRTRGCGQIGKPETRIELDCEQRPPDRSGEPSDADAEELLDRVRDRQLIAEAWSSPVEQLASHFECKQRIPERELDKPP